MSILQVVILAIVQGLAELLPVSSSAHVVVAEKLLGLDPSSPQMTLLLVMLHTGTMFAVIAYFWNAWKGAYFSSTDAFKQFAVRAVWATVLTAVIGYPILFLIEKTMFKGAPHAEIELLFGRLDLVGIALFCAGVLILLAGLRESRIALDAKRGGSAASITMAQAGWMGAVQGLCLPFRGFSRSGATISTGLLAGTGRERAERFSFALAVILTPPVVARELLRLLKATHEAASTGTPIDLHGSLGYALLGAVLSFAAGLAALKWLSAWLEAGRWYLFGVYCIVASGVVLYLHHAGY
jgi:undecaprenyl-diphosphatase